MTRLMSCAALLLAAGAIQLNAAVFETDWCTVQTPDAAVPGDPVTVIVTLKKDPGGQKLSTHLHWLKAGSGQFGGMLGWHKPLDAKVGAPAKFTFRPNIDPEKIHSIPVLVYLSPDGDFKNATSKASPPALTIHATAEKMAELAAKKRPATATFKNSSIVIEPTKGEVRDGDSFEVRVSYHLDPKDNWGAGTKLRMMPLGPWIDNPDGKFNTKRMHVSYPGIGTQVKSVAPGRGELVFTYKLRKSFQYNDALYFMATFIGADGKDWPWNTRGGNVNIVRSRPHYDLVVRADGGLFKYGEAPVVVVTGKPAELAAKDIRFALVGVDGKDVLTGKLAGGKWAGESSEAKISAKQTEEGIELSFNNLKPRGTFAVVAEAEGWGSRHAYFATIPDVAGSLKGCKTPFGVTNLSGEKYNRVAQSLGMSFVRHFVTWSTIEPKPGEWKLDRLDKTLAMNRAHGMDPWICLYNPPSWVMPEGVHTTRFCPFPFDAAAWQRSAAHLAKHYRGKVWGFEWLNEIVPGNMVEDPVKNYVDFCRIGTAEVRKHAPGMKIQMAGGLWPHNYRIDVLNAGIGDHVDVLPIHYGSGAGVETAKKDLAARGLAEKVTVWDNETARGMSTWEIPPRDVLPMSLEQCSFVLRQWPDELVAGCEAIIYFGGTGAAAGNWGYLLDEHTPRPVAATLALLSAKIGAAKPVGKFTADGARFHLFERDGKAVLIAASESGTPVDVTLRPWLPPLLRTDFQGNETTLHGGLYGMHGVVSLTLDAMPVFLEEADPGTLTGFEKISIPETKRSVLDTLKECLILEISSHVTVLDTGADTVPIPFILRNPYDRSLQGHVEIAGVRLAFDLAPHERLATTITAPAKPGANTVRLALKESPYLDTPFTLFITSLKDLGNLLKNGGFEESATKLASWSGNAVAHSADGLGLGLGKTVMRFNGSDAWQHESQGVTLPVPGATYLYTAWVWSDNISAGSNLSTTDANGKSQTFTMPHVFGAGNGTKYWRFLAHRRKVPDNVVKMSVTPVAKGKGWAMYDNVRVTKYEGTDFMAEAARAAQAPAMDGPFADWQSGCPVPLLCDNQITAHAPAYNWTPENLTGVAWFSWDAEHLYLGVEVMDDTHDARATDGNADRGDSLTVAVNPAPGTADATRAFEWKISAAHPGGGSGKHTLFRSPGRAGRMTAGHLAKDSSLYGISVTRDEAAKRTEYRVRIPWSEMDGVHAAPGGKFGCTIKLNDSDGAGLAGSMLWGGGIAPNWVPADFGLVTLVD